MAVPNIRMFPPGDGRHPVGKANGRTYTAGANGFVDVPSHDADVLHANGWTRIVFVGPTSSRPVNAAGLPIPDGQMFLDTTIQAAVVWQATGGFTGVWRNALTGAAV